MERYERRKNAHRALELQIPIHPCIDGKSSAIEQMSQGDPDLPPTPCRHQVVLTSRSKLGVRIEATEKSVLFRTDSESCPDASISITCRHGFELGPEKRDNGMELLLPSSNTLNPELRKTTGSRQRHKEVCHHHRKFQVDHQRTNIKWNNGRKRSHPDRDNFQSLIHYG
ncbi:hypothetical protein TNIN_53701 [Trichonephila inaurata madagascariensis]|uniref:Uncharacterized protein n=1 Tax=Trichonephila inaurata madagascariensis TaxID=2747483 RepID=A0A8X6XEF3_9ARAC|nr:hypothetical protein TNIN_53701 [Trichonephila inaurata madagascariensis]